MWRGGADLASAGTGACASGVLLVGVICGYVMGGDLLVFDTRCFGSNSCRGS